MTEMVERVARAIECKMFDEPQESAALHAIYCGVARAAIEAMREPTNKMLKASCGAMSVGKRPTPDRVSSKEKHRIRYQAMIDAELGRQTFAEAVVHLVVTNGDGDAP